DLQRVVVAMQAEPVAPALPGLATRLIDVPTEAADFDLQFTFTERAGDARLHVELRYDADLLRPGDADRLRRHFGSLLGLMLDEPERALGDVALADAAADDANGRSVPLEYRSMPDLFAALAREQPDAPALRTAGRTLSYRELAAEADRVAAGLAERGLTRGSVVGVLADRTPEAITAMLGILRGGQVYLPLRAGDSAERLRTICADGGASLVVDGTAGGWPGHDLGVPVVGPAAVRAADGSRAPAGPRAGDAAYLLFTSGSTGRPKGVLVGHRALLNRLLWARGAMAFGPGDRHLQKTALDFDVAVAEILQPFTSGGSLALAAPGAERDPSLLLAEVRAFGVTVMHFVPSVLRMVLDAGLTLPGTVRMVMCSGEALPASAARELLDRHPWVVLHNTYGPTETTIEMTHHLVTQPGDRAIVTIGRPIDNVGARVLDPALRRLPATARGELFVSGLAVAAGYLGRPRLTADKFVPDPYSGEPGARMYATGDICFRDDTGLLHFVERADRQVKVRGLRLELGAVETAIAAHPDVRRCAAVVDTVDGLGQRLTAYLAVPPDVDLDLDSVREQALRILPRHALPDRFVRLTDIPLTSSGKLDRAAAAAAAGHTVPTGPVAAAEAPRELVARVGEIWASVLGVDRVGEDDDFFALGGHSLLAAQCIARLGAGFGTGAPVAALFRHPRLGDFCSWWAGHLREMRPAAALPPVADRSSRLPLSAAQLRLWLTDQTTEPGHDYDLALGWLAPGATVDAVTAAFAQVVAVHEILRTGYRADDDGPYQQIHDGRRPEVRHHDDETASAGSLATRLLTGLRAEPFDLTGGRPPVAAAVGRSADGPVLVLNAHHIVLDGASVPLVTAALADALAGRPPRVPQRQYADFAAWEAASGPGRFTDGLRHQLHELDGAQPLSLPPVGSAGGTPAAAAGRHEATLSPEVTAGLSAGVTPFAGLLTAFAAATHCLTQEDDLVLGTDAANRLLPGTDEMVGFFVNQLPLRVRMAPEETLGDLLRRVGAVTVAGLEHQHVPFESIVEELKPPRRPGRTPLLVAKLVLQGAGGGGSGEIVELPDVDPAPSAKFDLLMAWTPTAGGGMRGVLEFATDAVTPAVAGWFVAVFGTCAEAIAAEPRLTVAQLGARVAERARSRLRAGRVLRSRPPAGSTSPKGL
ncbi:MAG: amino acid adenylation domain-containing protein, partial [Actinoplanes sp.]